MTMNADMNRESEWIYELPPDKTCFTEMTIYNEVGCADWGKVDTTDVPSTLGVGKYGGYTFLKSCDPYEIVLQFGDDEASAKASYEVKVPFQHKKGKVECVLLGDKFASWTASGWREAPVPEDETENAKGEFDFNPNATGAKSLAAAFTATALAVAATNF